MAPRPAPKNRITGNAIVWYAMTTAVGLLAGILMADRTAIFSKLLGSEASASQVQQFGERLEAVNQALLTHADLAGHPVDHTLLQVVTQDIREIKQDVKEILRRTNETQKGR